MNTNAWARRGNLARGRRHGWVVLWIALVGAAHAGMIDHQGMAPHEICGMCHSLDGISRMAKFPKLAGQKAAYITKQFLDFHGGRRTNDGGQMSGITTEVDTSHLDDIARYFSQLPAPPAVPLPDDGPSRTFYQKGAVLFHQGRDDLTACATCHGVQAEHLRFSPWLDAQHRKYLVKQLRDFKQGRRHNDQGAVMRSIAAKLTGDDIEALARYLASTTLRPRAK